MSADIILTRSDAAKLLGVAENARPQQIQAAYNQEIARYKLIDSPTHPITRQDYVRLAVAKGVLDAPDGAFDHVGLLAAGDSQPQNQPKNVRESDDVHAIKSATNQAPHTVDDIRADTVADCIDTLNQTKPTDGFVGDRTPLNNTSVYNNPRQITGGAVSYQLTAGQQACSDLATVSMDSVKKWDNFVAFLYVVGGAGLVGTHVYDTIKDFDMPDINLYSYPAALGLIVLARILQGVIAAKQRNFNLLMGSLHNFIR